MIDLNLKPASLAAPADSSFRYYEPAAPANGADRWRLGTATYRLVHVAVPLDGSDPIVTLVRQTSKGQDYARSGRRTATLRHIASVVDGDVNRISAHVQQVREALVRVMLDESRSVAATEVARDEVDYRAGDRTLFPADPSTGRMLPDLAGDDMSRVVVRIGAVPLGHEWYRILDQRSGLWVEVRRAHCGAECGCGGEVRLVEQPQPEGTTAAQVLSRYTGPDKIDLTLTAEGVRRLAAHTGETLAEVEAAARRQGMTVEPQPEQPAAPAWGGPAVTISVDEDVPLAEVHDVVEDDEQLDAVMREQMAQWPDDTLALTTVGELRGVLRRAVEAGATVADDDSVIVEQLIRELPIPAEERAAHGLPNVGRRESFERPGSAYDGVHGYDPHTHEAITDRRVVTIISALQSAVDNGHGLSLDDDHAAALLTYLGWQQPAGYVVADPPAKRLVRLATRHPEPEECTGDEYGTWLAVGSDLGEYVTSLPGVVLTAADIRVVAAHHNVSPFAVLDLLDKRGIAHEPDPQLVPEGSEVER